MKAWRFYAFGDMRLDDIELAACPPDHVLVEPLVVQPSATEAQLAFGIPTLAYDHVKSRLETDAPLQLFGHEFCAQIVEVGSAVTGYAPDDRVAALRRLVYPLDFARRDRQGTGPNARRRVPHPQLADPRRNDRLRARESDAPVLRGAAHEFGCRRQRLHADLRRPPRRCRGAVRAGYFMYNTWNDLQPGIQEMFETGQSPETGEQLLEKLMMFLLLFYSALERGGAMVQQEELGDSGSRLPVRRAHGRRSADQQHLCISLHPSPARRSSADAGWVTRRQK